MTTILAQSVVQTAARGMALDHRQTLCDHRRHDSSNDTCTSDSAVVHPPDTDEEVHWPLIYVSPCNTQPV